MKQRKGLLTKVIETDGVRLKLSQANVFIGMRRAVLRTHMAAAVVEEDPLEVQILRTISYPDMVAAVVEAEGFDSWPPTFEEFTNDVPDSFAEVWERTVYELNPHWNPEKKEPTASEEVKKES